jgi:hypothetical protein
MFDTTKEDLKAILRDVDEGTLQLPDFQRDYVWNEEDVRSLIASIAKGFPVGALLTLESGGPVAFKPRLLAGVPEKDVMPEELLLDGQQRMTSLYQTLFSQEPVKTRTPKGKEIERFYYFDIKEAVNEGADFEEVIVGVPRDKKLRVDFGRTVILDLSTEDQEFELDMFPLNRVFNNRKWFYAWRDHWKPRGRDVSEPEQAFYQSVLERIDDYKMPIIRLDRSNSREAICLVFEKVNVGGKKLDAFELVTAIYAASTFDLREDWNGNQQGMLGRRQRMIGFPNRRDVLTQIANTDFLQACTLLHTMAIRREREHGGAQGKELPQVSCKREALLGLPLGAYAEYADNVEGGFIQAGAFLNERKIIWNKDIPYPPQLVGLAAVFASLGHRAETTSAKEKLATWFWAGTLGELYGSSTDSRLARDVPELIAWISGGGPQPRSIDEALFQRDRLLTLRSRLAAAYKGIHALLMGGGPAEPGDDARPSGCLDFCTRRPAEVMTFLNDQIDIHHVFPQAWCIKQGIEPARFNSIINKTPLSKWSNIRIGGDAPSVYLKRIEEKDEISADKLDAILRTHLIEPQHLRNDDFDAFFRARQEALAGLVAGAMDKPVVSEQGTNEPEAEPESIVPEFDEAELELAS